MIEADQIALDVIVARSQEFQLQIISNVLAQLEETTCKKLEISIIVS